MTKFGPTIVSVGWAFKLARCLAKKAGLGNDQGEGCRKQVIISKLSYLIITA